MREPSQLAVGEAFLAHWFASTPAERREGRSWYSATYRYAGDVAGTYHVPRRTVAGMLAAYSPKVAWETARLMTETTLEYGEPTVGALELSETRAQRIKDGEQPLAVLRGRKTRAFYRAIMGDRTAPVVDTWMLWACEWHRDGMSHAQYDRVAGALCAAAWAVRMPVTTFQATVWTHVRDAERVARAREESRWES